MFGTSAAELLGKYDLSRGEPWLLVNVAIAAAPWIGARLRARAARRRARILVLVGPKGSGKSTLGRMLSRHAGVHSLDVEPIAKEVLAAMGNVIDEAYARRAFAAIARAVRDIERDHRVIVLETTGASTETNELLDRLRERHDVRLARIHAGPETCEARIKARDPSRQIQVSPELIREMHRRSAALALPWDLEVVNDPPMSSDEVDRAFGALLGTRRAP